MARKNKLSDWLMWIVGIVVSLGIGGLFLNGTFLTVPLLKILPSVVHTIVGYLIYITTGLAVIAKVIGKNFF